MTGILLTDFYTLRKQLSLCGLVGLVYIVIGIVNHSAASMMAFLVMFATVLSANSFSYNEQCQWDMYVNTLPVRREDMVNAKFALILLMGGGAFLLGGLAVVIDNLIYGAPVFTGFTVPVAAGACGLIYSSIFMVLIMKLGLDKARIYLVAAFLIPAICLFSLPKMGVDMESLLAMLDKTRLLLGLGALTVLVMAVSYLLCRIFYKTKEL